MALLSGTSTLRVWADGPDHSRVQLIADGAESDVVHNGSDLWVWDSAGKQAYHATLPATGTMPTPTPTLPSDLLTKLPTTPQQAATLALAAIDPSTTVTTDSTASVAGHSAYRLVATPKTPGSLVARVVISIDATTHVPLRVEVYSTQRTAPALSVGFKDVTFVAPAADVFAFTPPAGATVTQAPTTTTPKTPGDATGTHPAVRTVGTGWATVAVIPASGTQKPLSGSIRAVLTPVSGSWGSGYALSGTLFSVLVKDDGTVAVGAVPVQTLESAVASTGSTGTGK
jgi:outer membrane lipoprotein-sorting protein